MILYADGGGTKTRVWKKGSGKITELIVGLRGVWTPTERKSWAKRLKGIAPTITVLSDIELHHRLKFGDKPGITLNAGTGSIAFGRNKDGQTARAGGFGPLIGDEGSGFWLGKEYLKLQYQIDPDLKKVRPYAVGENPVAKIAGLAPKVLGIAARRPNSYERRIVNEAIVHLSELVKEVRMTLRMPADVPIYTTGGLFQNPFFRSLWKTSRSRR